MKNAKTLVVKTKRLKKSTVKGSLKGTRFTKVLIRTSTQKKALEDVVTELDDLATELGIRV